MEKYDKRFVAFLDILGFKDLITKTKDPLIFKIVKNSLDYISNVREEHYHGFYANFQAIDKEVSVFSDSIVISYSQSVSGGLFYILMDLIYICIRLNQNGIFVRGGISFGELYHKNHVCFGPALIEAYHLEQDCAIYPRIIVNESTIINGIKIHGLANAPKQESQYLAQLLEQGENDKLIYLDYLSQSQEMDEPNEFYLILKSIKKHIVRNLIDSKYNRKVFKKYRWFSKYYNKTIKKLYRRPFYINNQLLISDELIKYSL